MDAKIPCEYQKIKCGYRIPKETTIANKKKNKYISLYFKQRYRGMLGGQPGGGMLGGGRKIQNPFMIRKF